MLEDVMLNSKTFVFLRVVNTIPFIEEIDKEHIIRVWHDKEVRVTVPGKDKDRIDKIADRLGALDPGKDNEKYNWKDTWK
jgi:hypothetical protein